MMKWIFGIYVGGNVGAHTAAKVKLGNGPHPPAAVTNGHPGVIIAQDDVHLGTTTPSPYVAVRTMSGKDPEEVVKRLAASQGIDTLNLVKSQQQLMQEQQRQMMQQQEMSLTDQTAQMQAAQARQQPPQ